MNDATPHSDSDLYSSESLLRPLPHLFSLLLSRRVEWNATASHLLSRRVAAYRLILMRLTTAAAANAGRHLKAVRVATDSDASVALRVK